MKWGRQRAYHQALRSKGYKVPPQASRPPEIRPHLSFVWGAFWELGTERQVGMALGPIPGSKIRKFACEHGIGGEWFDSFLSLIRSLDGEYLQLMAPKDRKQSNVIRGDDVEGVKAILNRAAKLPGG